MFQCRSELRAYVKWFTFLPLESDCFLFCCVKHKNYNCLLLEHLLKDTFAHIRHNSIMILVYPLTHLIWVDFEAKWRMHYSKVICSSQCIVNHTQICSNLSLFILTSNDKKTQPYTYKAKCQPREQLVPIFNVYGMTRLGINSNILSLLIHCILKYCISRNTCPATSGFLPPFVHINVLPVAAESQKL